MKIASLNGWRFFVVLIDNRSNSRVYFLKTNNNTLQKFKQFNATILDSNMHYWNQFWFWSISNNSHIYNSLWFSWMYYAPHKPPRFYIVCSRACNLTPDVGKIIQMQFTTILRFQYKSIRYKILCPGWDLDR